MTLHSIIERSRSECCGAALTIVSSDEGTGHYECVACHKPTNPALVRWYAARNARVDGRRVVYRLRGQPDGGFDFTEVLGWLIERGLVRREAVHPNLDDDENEGVNLVGWGDPYCMVPSYRDDPWEPEEAGRRRASTASSRPAAIAACPPGHAG